MEIHIIASAGPSDTDTSLNMLYECYMSVTTLNHMYQNSIGGLVLST
jgi:hypothetical protein